MFNKYVAKIIPFILEERGILNLGGKTREIFSFAKKFTDKKISGINFNKVKNYPKNTSLNIQKLIKILKKKKLKINDFIK